MSKVTLDINIPSNVTKSELEHFLKYKFMGFGGDDEVLSKFKCEELDVNYFEIELDKASK